MLKNKWIKFEYINNFLIIQNWEEFLEIYKILEEKKIEVIGFYVNNILFYQKDLNFELMNKKVICKGLIKKVKLYNLTFLKLLLILKRFKIKINILLNKK